MKKLKIFILALVMSLTCFGVAAPVQAYADSEVSPASTYVTTNGLGYTINVATATNPLNINLGAPVLDETYLNSLEFVRLTREEAVSQTYKSVNITDISNNLTDTYNSAVSGTFEYDLFKASVTTGFQDTLSIDYSIYESKYFSIHYYERLIYEESLPSYTAFPLIYSDYYSQAFLYNLESLVGENATAQDYYDFFDTFGTHLVASVKMGGKLESYYSVVSNEIAYTSSIQNSISECVDVSIANFSVSGSSTSLNLNTSNTTLNNSIYSTRVKVIGGEPQYVNSLQSKVGGDYQNWYTTLSADNAVIIGYSQGGLLPLWDILPEEYSTIATTMEEHFEDYIANVSTQYTNPFKYTGAKSTYVYNEKLQVLSRTSEYRITHDGVTSNLYDEINLKTIYGVYASSMQNDGVTTVRMTLSINIKEVNDGYQYIYIMSDLSTSVVTYYQIEHGPGKVLKDYATYSYTIDIPVSRLIPNDKIYIRYNADGKYDDDWINSNLIINLELVK